MNNNFKLDVANNDTYLSLLSAIAKLSGLFSESNIPFINYRAVENIFCKSFNAVNLSRSDTAFDANLNSVGIGLKTFVCETNNKTEKIAEFNSLAQELSKFKNDDLAYKLACYRNERINLAKRLYNLQDSIYHIVARKNKELILFETDYAEIDINGLSNIKQNATSLSFADGKNLYSFNFSKSTLFRKFFIPENSFSLPIETIDDPYSVLLQLLSEQKITDNNQILNKQDYVILPLYGLKNKQKYVFEKSGLNQWNASGRKRDFGEVYIPIPAIIHKNYPNFFPKRDVSFKLQIPTGEILSAKICQDNSKALMTNPNNALANWLLRKIFGLEKGQLLTINRLNELGFDSVIIYKKNDLYKIDKAKLNSFDNFILAK